MVDCCIRAALIREIPQPESMVEFSSGAIRGWGSQSMSFLGQTVIIIAMTLISLSIGGIAYMLLDLKLETAALLTTGLFALLVIFQMAAWRVRDRKQTGRDLNDIGRALESVTRDIAILNNKVSSFEHAGVIRAAQDVAALRIAMEHVQSHMQQVNTMLQQHYELIHAARHQAVFGQKKNNTGPVSEIPDNAPQRRGPLSHLDENAAMELVRTTLDQGRIEIMLQPIVTLPQRKIRWYELLSRLRLESGEILLPDDFLPFMRKGELGATFDALVLYRAVQLVRRMQTRNKEIGVVVNLCPSTLAGGDTFEALLEFLAANSALSDALILEVTQNAYHEFGPLEFESLAAIAALGFRFSLDQARDLRFDVKGLADRGFRYVKTPGEVLLGRSAEDSSDIHPADISDLMTRFGITLIADRIEAESTVIDLLDYDIGYAQGFLFAPPRPVKAEVLDDIPFETGKAALSA